MVSNLKVVTHCDDPRSMQRIRITRERLARFDIAKLSIVIAAAAALVLTMTIAAPSGTRLAGPSAINSTHVTKVTSKSKISGRSTANTNGSTANTSSADRGAGVVPDASGGVGPPPAGSIEAPPYIISNCSVDVSAALQTWLQGLPTGTIWYSPVGSCYLINKGINLSFTHGITIDGGIFVEKWLGWLGRRAFLVIGGSDMTFEHMTINGPNLSDVWVPARAFQSGIELEGTVNATISDVRITHVFGDGLTFAPLRGSADHSSGKIIRPVTNLIVDKVWIDGAGRQGVSPVSVLNATMTDITIHHVHMNAFDFEADQGNEGAINVTINGCTVVDAIALANISENAGFTGPITIENCDMATLDGGTAVYVRSTSNSIENGLISLENDSLRCQTRAPVACIQFMNGQNISISDSTITFGPGEFATESVFSAIDKTHATFANDVVTGYGNRGSVQKHSTVTISGGTWTQR